MLGTSSACRRGPKVPRPTDNKLTIQDFEGNVSISSWPTGTTKRATRSSEWAAEGKYSLRLDPEMMGSFTELQVRDWRGFSLLRFSVHNPAERTVSLGLEIQDRHTAFHERHQQVLGVAPGDHEIVVDFSGGLHRGEENRPYRGRIKTPIDLSQITRLAFMNQGKDPVFVDRIEIERVAPIATSGGFAFDFGRTGTQVMGQAVGVNENTAYDAARGYGFIGDKPWSLRRSTSYPTALLGDGLSFGHGAFRVDLKGGPYLGWVAFERSGFWEGEQSGYTHADLLVNGRVVTGHDFSVSGPHFFFEDTELTRLEQLPEMVQKAHAIARFQFRADPGENRFTVAVKDLVGPPLRVAGMFLAPDTDAGRAFIEAQIKRQTEAMLVAYPPQDRGRRLAPRAKPSADLVAEVLEPGAQVFPRDYPEHGASKLSAKVLGVAGQTAVLHLGVYAARDTTARVETSGLHGSDSLVIAPPVVSHGRYLPARALGGGPVWLEVNHYRPEPSFPIGIDVARSVLVEWPLPLHTRPGRYTGTISIHGRDMESAIVNVELEVVPIALPEIPIPVGLFMNALPFGPEMVGETRFWALQTALLEEQARAGLNCVTGGAGLSFEVEKKGDDLVVTGPNAILYLELARTRMHLRAAVSYGGFWNRLSNGWVDVPAFSKAWGALASQRKLPPFLFYAYDEPGTASEADDAVEAVLPFTRAGLPTIGFLTARRAGSPDDRLVDATYATAFADLSGDDLRDLAKRGKHPWTYNQGLDRFGMGLRLLRNIRAGAEGRLEWIGLITQGFAFDDLDGREPSLGAWVIHDRLGVLPTPRWIAAREGLLDLRIRLALEQLVSPEDPALAVWPLEAKPDARTPPSDAVLSAARAVMVDRIQRAPAAK